MSGRAAGGLECVCPLCSARNRSFASFQTIHFKRIDPIKRLLMPQGNIFINKCLQLQCAVFACKNGNDEAEGLTSFASLHAVILIPIEKEIRTEKIFIIDE